MQLVVDANVLVAELSRARGRELLMRPILQLFTTPDVTDETAHELGRRVGIMLMRGRVLEEEARNLLADAERVMAQSLTVHSPSVYAHHLESARRRMLRDADDVPTAALAMSLGCGIWTNDRDFFGCGIPVWSTEVLLMDLPHLQSDQSGDHVEEC